MSDLISRSAVIKELNGIYLDNPWDDKEDILEKAIGIVEHFPTVHNNGWIPCSERLPELETEVLVCNKFGVITTASLSKPDINWEDGDGYLLLYIIAWQPLPTPYVQQ